MPHDGGKSSVRITMLGILLMLNVGVASNAMPDHIYDFHQCNCSDCVAFHQTELFEEGPVEDEVQYVVLEVPNHDDNSFKTYMDYRAITDRSSKQWKLQQEAYTNEYGFRMVDDYYCIALGSAFSNKIGAKFEITLQNGQTFKGILADQKSDLHTDKTNRYMELSNGKINVVEFIVETEKLEKLPRIMGDVSHTSSGLFDGEIVEIKEVIDEETNTGN